VPGIVGSLKVPCESPVKSELAAKPSVKPAQIFRLCSGRIRMHTVEAPLANGKMLQYLGLALRFVW
jgi:hypothetical protein